MIEGDWFDVGAVVTTVKSMEKRDIRPSEVRRMFKTYIEHGYIEQDNEGRYRVTEAAIEKFELGTKSQTSETPNENEAPNGEATGASETDGWGVASARPVLNNPYPWRQA